MIKGYHLIIDATHSNRLLGDKVYITKFLNELPRKIGMRKITRPKVIVHLKPGDPEWGVTGFVIIAESHIAVHTYPDRRYFALDIFSCKKFNAKKILEVVKESFGGVFRYRKFKRGIN